MNQHHQLNKTQASILTGRRLNAFGPIGNPTKPDASSNEEQNEEQTQRYELLLAGKEASRESAHSVQH